MGGKNFDEPEIFRFFERAEELGVLIFMHARDVAAADRLQRYWLSNLIGNPLDTTIAQASLILAGFWSDCPNSRFAARMPGVIRLGLAGAGATASSAAKNPGAISAVRWTTILSRFYFDTVIFNRSALEFLIRTMGVIVFYSERTIRHPWQAMAKFQRSMDSAGSRTRIKKKCSRKRG
ncbi:MAG: hypothetical protein ACREQW_19455 [Candidatus Binatia bacterium]